MTVFSNKEKNKSLILTVDDKPVNLQILGALLSEHGYEVGFAIDARQAYVFLENNPVDLILLDIEMPLIDGYEACTTIKADGRYDDIPIIFVTAKYLESDILKGFEVGAVDYVTKPFKGKELLSRVKTHITLKNVKDELAMKNNQLNEEINKAVEVHKRTLPASLPRVEGFSMAAHYQPAAKMGGDSYNITKKGDKLIVYIADVMGHGLDGAMLSVFLKEAIDSYICLKPEDISPGNIVRHLTGQYQRENYSYEYFICIFMAVIDLVTMELSYTSAGFQTLPLIKYGDGRTGELKCKGIFIGNTIPLAMYNHREFSDKLTPGTAILISSDGLAEQDGGNEWFYSYYQDIFYKNSHLPAEEIVRKINDAFYSFNNNSAIGNDDITYLVLKVE